MSKWKTFDRGVCTSIGVVKSQKLQSTDSYSNTKQQSTKYSIFYIYFKTDYFRMLLSVANTIPLRNVLVLTLRQEFYKYLCQFVLK